MSGEATEAQVVEIRISQRLRRLRRERGLTLEAVAGPAGLSGGYLSRIEQGRRVPTIGTLALLARTLEVGLAELVGDAEPSSIVIRSADAPRYASGGAEITQVSSPARSVLLEATLVRLESGALPPRPVTHAGEEWLHVLSGSLELTLDDEQYRLVPGDSAQFDATLPHLLRGAPNVEVLVVSTRRRPE